MKQVKIAQLRAWSHAKLIQGSFLTKRTFSCSLKQQQQHESEAESSFPWKNQQSHPIIPSSDIQSWLPGRLLNHPLNEMTSLNATKYTIPLGDIVGLKHAPVHLVTLQAGQMSTVDHFHHHTEEWIYIIDGEGTAIIDGKENQIEKGAFLGFKRTESGPSHNLKNTSNTGKDLVYLCGGERRNFDVCIYPTVDKIMVTEAPNTVKWVKSLDEAKSSRVSSARQLPSLESIMKSDKILNVPDSLMRAVIGRRGVAIKKIRSDSQAEIIISDTPNPTTHERVIGINGSQVAIEKAMTLINEVLEEEKSKQAF